jgi:hypothetical protein
LGKQDFSDLKESKECTKSPKGLKERDANFITLSGPGYIHHNTGELGQVLL